MVLTILLLSTAAYAQKEFDGTRGTHSWMRFSDAPNALYHHLAGQAYGYLDARSAKVSNLNTLEEWKAWQQSVRATLHDIVGQFPPKTPLNPRITKTVEKDGYSVENIVFESQPGFYVTASLFIPSGLKKRDRAPAVIYCSGHSKTAYRSHVYQHVILNLVAKGFVVFAFDPIGQGERLQYYDQASGRSHFSSPSQEHSYAGAQLFMTGSSMAKYMIWDGIRAVDYLLTRREVDPKRIGITGRSGGGTQSAIIAALDQRILAAAPENYITNFSRLLQSMGPQCAEQEFFNGISRGIDMADLLLVRAPRPALMITTTRDMFPIHGSIETAAEVSRIYKAYGAPDDFRMVTDDAPHASTKKNREAMYAFFQKYLKPGDSSDIDVKILKDEELQVTRTGQLATSLEAATVFDLNVKEAQQRERALAGARNDVPEYVGAKVRLAKKLSGYREPRVVTDPVFTGRIQREGYTVEKYFIKGEGNYVIPYIIFEPEKRTGKALLYLHPKGKAEDAETGGEMEWFARNGFTVLAPDLIGTGEMGPGEFKGDSYIGGVSYNLWFGSMLIGRSIVGIQAGDVVRLAHLLAENHEVKEIYGFAKREMAPVLLHAAAFDDAIINVALVEPYASYRSIVMNRFYNPEFLHSTVPGSVGVYDLPDLAGSLVPGRLLIANITDGTGGTTDSSTIDEAISVIRDAYQKQGNQQHFVVAQPRSAEELQDLYRDWMDD